MKTLTATAARRRFGALIKVVQQEPVLVVRRNGDRVIFISAEKYKQMRGITSFDAVEQTQESAIPRKPR